MLKQVYNLPGRRAEQVSSSTHPLTASRRRKKLFASYAEARRSGQAARDLAWA
jgi:hypothetical protein